MGAKKVKSVYAGIKLLKTMLFAAIGIITAALILALVTGSRVESINGSIIFLLLIVVVVIAATILILSRLVDDLIVKPVDYLENLTKTIISSARKVEDVIFVPEEYSKLGEELVKIAEFIDKKEEEVKSKAMDAQSANIAKREFLSNMSHELRTPLNGIVGMAELLAFTKIDEEQKRYIDILKVSSSRMLSVISDILDMSRIEAGKIELIEESFSIKMLLSKMTGLFEKNSMEKGNAMKLNIGAGIEEYYSGDGVRLEQVMANLLSNAIKFTSNGEITIGCKKLADAGESDVLEITVSDTGIGIPKEKINNIFDKFYQVDYSTSRRFDGAGLGLSISKKLLEIMGGEITAESIVGVGSKFTVTISLKKDKEKNLLQKNMGKAYMQVEAKEKPMPVQSGEKSGIRILLAEDDAVNQESTRIILEKRGYVVSIAKNGKVAVEMARTGSFDLILMDIEMPEMNGREAAEKIREREDGRKIPIIALTAYAYKSEKEKCLKAGMDDYLSKPYIPESLYTMIERYRKPRR